MEEHQGELPSALDLLLVFDLQLVPVPKLLLGVFGIGALLGLDHVDSAGILESGQR